ncbi:hypothetical protein [Rhizohabitans arisaemae]|uniref:hypothetical protein n=1 Tax=Rhizohabitans arisaemae TaxID=2720610 RepID=UPI0024B0CF50|nr:hypothetical protein [Rhizohabitans arisaemae]
MTRSELDDIRESIRHATETSTDTLLEIAQLLLMELERARMREATLRSHYVGLLSAARASVAAQRGEAADPLTFLTHELARHGQLPPDGPPHRILADARANLALVDGTCVSAA